jgi:PAS domain S-box-containing protein
MARRDVEQHAPGPMRVGSSTADITRFWDLALGLMGTISFDGYLTQVNKAYCEVLGWSVEDLTSVPYWEFVHPGDRDAIVESSQLLLDGTVGSLVGYDMRMLRRDGSYRWTRWTTRADPEDELLYGIGTDVDDLRTAVDERVVTGTWTCDARADEFRCSDEMLVMLGFTDRSTTYEMWLSRVATDDRPRVDRALRTCLARTGPYEDDFRIRRADGDLGWVHAAGRMAPDRGRSAPLHGIFMDVTATPRPASALRGA